MICRNDIKMTNMLVVKPDVFCNLGLIQLRLRGECASNIMSTLQ